MPKYVLNRNYTLRTVDGTVEFKKGEPAWVVPVMERHVVSIGAEAVDAPAPDPLGAPEAPKAPALMPDERAAQIRMAFETLIERNDAKDFTGQGVPTVKAVERIVSFDVDRVEVMEAWTQMKVDKAEAEQ